MQLKPSLLLLPAYGLLSLAQQGAPSVQYPFLLTLQQQGETYFLQVPLDQDSPYVAKINQADPPSNFTLSDGILEFADLAASSPADGDETDSPRKLFFVEPEQSDSKTTFEAVDKSGDLILLPTQENAARGFTLKDDELFISVSEKDDPVTLTIERFA